MTTEQDRLGPSATPSVAGPARPRRAGGPGSPADPPLRPVLGLWTALTASDPGLQRLRWAGTIIATVAGALAVLVGLSVAAGQPVTVAMLGVVVAMISTASVDEPTLRRQGLVLLMLVPASAGSVALAAELDRWRPVGEAVFVLLAGAAVVVRRWGQRGLAIGMVAFMSYFFALFLMAAPGQVPALAVAVVVGVAVSWAVRALLRPRHPERDVARMVAALRVRTGRVVEQLGQTLGEGRLEGRRLHRLRRQMGRAGEAALMTEQQLDGADDPVAEGLSNEELAVRVFDAQLATEHLATAALALVHEGPAADAPELARASAALRALGSALRTPADRAPEAQVRRLAGLVPRWPVADDPRVDRVRVTIGYCVESWERVLTPEPDEAAGAAADRPEVAMAAPDGGPGNDGDASGGDGNAEVQPWSETLRPAVQVALASALAIVVGEVLSPVRWFWAVIAAFVVFTGTSTRGEILSKAWQRTLGTMAGLVAGVLVAALVGGEVVASLVLILVCLFLGFYLVRVSYALMIFFVTTMLALLYGLLGSFTVELLVLRLEETAAGAAIGVLVSFLVLPASTRRAVREDTRDFLTALGSLLEEAVADLAGRSDADGSAPDDARELRAAFETVKSSSKPLTHGLSGLNGRSGFRHVQQVLAVCEHHARALTRAAHARPGAAAPAGVRHLVELAGHGVRDDVAALGRLFEEPVRPGDVLVRPADGALARAGQAVREHAGEGGEPLTAALRHLRAIDGAVCGLAADLGAGTAVAPTAGA